MKGAVQHDVWSVLFDIERERQAQDVKWGEQNHPDFKDGIDRPVYYRIADADVQRSLCDQRFRGGSPDWASILMEEVAEAIEAEGVEHLREELVQAAAVTVAWIQAIDRRAGTQPETGVRSDGTTT